MPPQMPKLTTNSNVKVAVRVRPMNAREKERNCKLCIRMEGSTTEITNPSTGEVKRFTFDYSYWSYDSEDPSFITQEHVYKDLGEGVLQNAWEGYNNCLFAYGQTGSGKSHSMVGFGSDEKARGIIPRCCEGLFKGIEEKKSDPTMNFKVEVSMLEIYNENIRDLLDPKRNQRGGLKIRESPSVGVFVENLSRNVVDSQKGIEKLMSEGAKARTVAATNMNETSSRAHTVFTIYFTQTKTVKEKLKATDRVSKINLVDLAGSERVDSTGNTGDRLREGCHINKSLSALGNVISVLAEPPNPTSGKRRHVPYRDSVLTRILQESLGGNSKTFMVAAISPGDINYDETMSTLRYADRAKQIVNKAHINEDPNEQLIAELRREIQALRRQLEQQGGGPAKGLTPKQRQELEKLLVIRKKLQKGEELTAEELSLAGDPPSLKEVEARIEHLKGIDEGNEEMASHEVMILKEQLKASESLVHDINKTWEERLAETVRAAEARQKDLESAGLAAVGVPNTKDPYLMNLNEDAVLNGNLIYQIKPGTTRIGRKDASSKQDIQLKGVSIKPEHAVIENNEKTASVTLSVASSADCPLLFVNGEPVVQPVALKHGCRLIIGNNHVFKYHDPKHIKKQGDSEDFGSIVDFEFARKELLEKQGVMKGISDDGSKREEELTKILADKEKEIEENLKREADRIQQEYEKEKQNLKIEQAERIKDMVAKQIELEKSLDEAKSGSKAAEQKRLEDELQKVRADLDDENDQLKAALAVKEKAIEDIRSSLAEKLESERIRMEEEFRKKQSIMDKRNALEDKLLVTIPLVEEATAIAVVFERPIQFNVKLAIMGSNLDMVIQVTDLDSGAKMIWSEDKFMDRMYIIREIYTNYMDFDTYPDFSPENDPFYDPPFNRIMGSTSVYLDSLTFLLEIEDTFPVVDRDGNKVAEISVVITPKEQDGVTDAEVADDDNPEALIGQPLCLEVKVVECKILSNLWEGISVKGQFYNGELISAIETGVRTGAVKKLGDGPVSVSLDGTRMIRTKEVDQAYFDYLFEKALKLEISGKLNKKCFMADAALIKRGEHARRESMDIDFEGSMEAVVVKLYEDSHGDSAMDTSDVPSEMVSAVANVVNRWYNKSSATIATLKAGMSKLETRPPSKTSDKYKVDDPSAQGFLEVLAELERENEAMAQELKRLAPDTAPTPISSSCVVS